MASQDAKPLRARKAMDDCNRAEVDEARGDGGFLSGNDDTDTVVALLADCGEEGIGEGGGGGGECGGYVLWCSFSFFFFRRRQ